MSKLIDTLDNFTRHYLIAALWSSNDESTEAGGEPMDATYDLNDIAPDTVEQAKADCAAFQLAAADLLAIIYPQYKPHPDAGSPEASAGHDFWLTRGGHGVGFWDRGFGDVGDQISAMVGYGTAFPEVNLYVGDDGKIHA